MWIYKITCDVTDKIYIGQSINPIQKRFKRHINNAVNNILNTHLARAIRKYGPEHFKCEELESGITNNNYLTIREHYWITYYNSVKEGYNETDAIYKCGGNTFINKSQEELDLIKEKIRNTKLGGLNPHAVHVKLINIFTKEEKIFSSQKECADFLKIKDHSPISKRCLGKIKKPLFGKYNFEYFK